MLGSQDRGFVPFVVETLKTSAGQMEEVAGVPLGVDGGGEEAGRRRIRGEEKRPDPLFVRSRRRSSVFIRN